MKKFGLIISIILFAVLVARFISEEVIRHKLVKEEIQEVVNDPYLSTRSQLFNIIEVSQHTLLDVSSVGDKVIKEKEYGWVLEDGSVIDIVDNWMLSMLERKAKPSEVQEMFRGIFEVYASGFYFSSFLFYLLHLGMFAFASIAPVLLSFVFSAVPTAVSLKYAGAAATMLLIVAQTRADETSFEVDLSCNGEENSYEFFLMNFSKRMTNVFYIPPGSVIAATGPNFSVAGGNLSLLGGARFGAGKKGITVTDISSWYLFFTSLLDQRLDYVTFGLYEKSIRSEGWWVWFKHQFNLPVGKKIGVGVREDTIVDQAGRHTTYGPVLQLKWSSAVIHVHGRFGNEQRSLFMLFSVPIN